VLRGPRHPYTQVLLAASPSLEKKKLLPIPGDVGRQLTALPPVYALEPLLRPAAGGDAPQLSRGCVARLRGMLRGLRADLG